MAKIARINRCGECGKFIEGDCEADYHGVCHDSNPDEDKLCPLPDADEYDRALVVRGIEMMRKAMHGSPPCREDAVADRLIQEVRDGRKG